MPYCESCRHFKEKMTVTKVGIWMGYCLSFKINRSIDNDICDRYQENNEIEKVTVHRAEIKLERLDEHFE
jgi:hypothetical protein